jgi:hypothetical protein
VTLAKHGADLVGHCPFHDDATPSLVITPGKNLWRCFGACDGGGEPTAPPHGNEAFIPSLEGLFSRSLKRGRPGLTPEPLHLRAVAAMGISPRDRAADLPPQPQF